MNSIVTAIKNRRIGLLTLVLILWGANAIRLQQIEYELQTTVALSTNRVDRLVTVAKRPSRDDIRILNCKRVANSQATALQQSLASASSLDAFRLRIRVDNYTDLGEVEAWLDRSTRPTSPDQRCQAIKRQLLHAHWELETYTHTARLLDRDREREKEQTELQGSKLQTPFRLVGFKPSNASTRDECPITQETQKKHSECQARIEVLQQELCSEELQSQGIFKFSGDPKKYPVAHPIGLARAIALIVLLAAVWGITAIACHSARFTLDWRRTLSWVESKLAANQERGPAIPFLGVVPLYVESEFVAQEISAPSDSEGTSSAATWLTGNRLVYGFLMIWVALMVARMTLDSSWRQVFLTAPLAGVSHLLTGVP
jgi:hypothetical protein